MKFLRVDLEYKELCPELIVAYGIAADVDNHQVLIIF